MPSWQVTADQARFDEASDWFAKRTVMTASQARALDDTLKQDAFWVGGGLQINQVQRVFDSLESALAKGTPFEEWRKQVRGELRDPAHAETVFRNATQRAYNAGRWAQMHEPFVLKMRPYFLYDAVLDARTTVICKSYDGTLLPADDPWWDGRVPPLHHRCRSSIRNLRKSEAERRGVTPSPSSTLPDPGWGHVPKVGAGWKPDPSKHDPALIKALNDKAPKGTRNRRPRTKPEHTAAFYEAGYRTRYGDAAPSLARGKAALERGLDMKVARARELLGKLDAPGVVAMLEALQDADAERSIRSQGGELDPLRKAAAALAGHMDLLKRRPAVKHDGLARLPGGKRALDLLTRVTGKSVQHPDDSWSFFLVRRGGVTIPDRKLVEFDRTPGTLEHEIGHAIEHLNPSLFARAKAFLEARAKTYPLIDHGKDAGGRVLAWDDNFAHWYTGRRYVLRGKMFGTEVTSTGLEVLVANRIGSATLSQLMQKDPEHFLFLLGQLAGP